MSAPQRTGLLDRGWEETQIKVFTRWCQKYLSQQKIEFNDIRTDFRDGVKLLQLLQIIGKDPLPGKWHQVVKNRYHQLENVQLAIKYITEVKEIKLVGIHPEEIVDGNLKITLGLAWSCINKFQIEDISVEEKTARDALLIWCQKNTRDYDISITNFTTSWSSGLAFCALINHFRPNELDYDALNKDDHMANVTAAFDACRRIGLTVFLDPEDLVGCVPDDKSVVTQVSEFFHFFASESKITAMADKIKSTLKNQKQIDEMSNLYEQQAQAALDAMAKEKESIESDEYERTVPGVRAKLGDVIKYAHTARPQIIELRGTALRTWASIVTKCKPISRKVPVPPEGKEPETLKCQIRRIRKTFKLSAVQNFKKS
ncbi:putative alpha-actinin [Histomonas meleagridis]|nr:putative alpha-actinin [Histomonas meleagridis]